MRRAVHPMAEQPSRRSFLRLAGAAAALGEVAPLRGSAPPGGDDYWQMVRRQFPFREDKVPMNAANLCPAPRAVAEQVAELTRATDVDCSFQSRARFHDLLEASRR